MSEVADGLERTYTTWLNERHGETKAAEVQYVVDAEAVIVKDLSFQQVEPLREYSRHDLRRSGPPVALNAS